MAHRVKSKVAVFLFIFALLGYTKVRGETKRYKLFDTKNIWTKLLLDTRTGKVWQVMFSINKKYIRSKTPINNKELVLKKDGKNGRFNLYPTDNMWNFILLDQENGNVWQCQYCIENDEQKFVIPILERKKVKKNTLKSLY